MRLETEEGDLRELKGDSSKVALSLGVARTGQTSELCSQITFRT